MKKYLLLLTSLCLLVVLSACTATAGSSVNQDEPQTRPVSEISESTEKDTSIATSSAVTVDEPVEVSSQQEEQIEAVSKTITSTVKETYYVASSAVSSKQEEKQTETVSEVTKKPKKETSSVESSAVSSKPLKKDKITSVSSAVTSEKAEIITREQAINSALQAAGVTRDSVFDLDAELDREREGLLWEVDFETREYEYSYDINAQTGAVVYVEKEKND